MVLKKVAAAASAECLANIVKEALIRQVPHREEKSAAARGRDTCKDRLRQLWHFSGRRTARRLPPASVRPRDQNGGRYRKDGWLAASRSDCKPNGTLLGKINIRLISAASYRVLQSWKRWGKPDLFRWKTFKTKRDDSRACRAAT